MAEVNKAAYIRRTFDYLKPEIRDLLNHTEFCYDPIIHGMKKTEKEFLDWFQRMYKEQYEELISSRSLKPITLDKKLKKYEI